MMQRLVVVVVSVLLLSCSAKIDLTKEQPVNWQQQLRDKEGITTWKIRGRLGIQTENNGGSLDLFWNHKAGHYQLRLVSQMGQGAVFIRGDDNHIYVKTSEGQEVYSADVDSLYIKNMGITIPLTSLREWIKGIPANNQSIELQQWNSQGYLAKLVQNKWKVEFSEYTREGSSVLPHRFYIEHQQHPAVEIRLFIHHWGIT